MSEIFDYIDNLVKSNKTVLFMKGTKDFPQCGFSAMVVNILNQLNVEFVDVDILKNQDLRQGIKDYTDWPTIPQLYINGEFIGGCDIVKDLYQNGELNQLFGTESK